MGDKKVINLAEFTNKSDQWTPEQMLEFIVEQIQSGEIDPSRMIVSWVTETGSSDPFYSYYAKARVSDIQAIGLLEIAKNDIIANLSYAD